MRRKMDEMSGIVCCFRKHDEKTNRSMMNRLAACYTASPYIHAEFYFPADVCTVTVDSRRPVTFIDYGKDYSDPKEWECYVIWVEREQYLRVFNFCRSQEGKPFERSGIWFFFLSRIFTRRADGESWICCRLMCEALKKGGILPCNIDSHLVTPSSLRELVLELKGYAVEEYKSN